MADDLVLQAVHEEQEQRRMQRLRASVPKLTDEQLQALVEAAKGSRR